MRKYTLDTNVIIDALNLLDSLEALLGFLRFALPMTYLSSIVVHEIAAGASTPKQRALLDQQLIGPFVRRGRLLTPSASVWESAGNAIGQGYDASTASALNDLLLAFSCRETGLTLITRDSGMSRLKRVVKGLRTAPPFPAMRDARSEP